MASIPAGLLVAAVVITFVVALLGVVAVKCLSQKFPEITTLANAISGGIILGVALLHMLPENIDALSDWGEAISEAVTGHHDHETGHHDDAYPIGFFITVLGFFFMIFLEHCFCRHQHGHQDDDHAQPLGPQAISMPGRQEGKAEVDAELGDEDDTSQDDVSSQLTADFSQSSQGHSGSTLGGLATLLGFLVHTFLEALAIGAQPGATSMLVLVCATGFHRFSAAFAVANSLQGVCGGSQCAWWILSLTFVLAGPIGIGVGVVLGANVEGVFSSVLLLFAAGTLLAIGITEMLLPAFEAKSWRRRNVMGAFCGFLSMAVLAFWA